MLREFQRELPAENIIQWAENTSYDKAAISAAIVWMPPVSFFDGLDNLTYIYAVSAGVDNLLHHPGLPPKAEIVRLIDAGMAVQMEEYVLYGVLMAQRGFIEYAIHQKQKKWTRGSALRSASGMRVGILGAGALGQAVARRLLNNGYPVSCWSRQAKNLPDGLQSLYGAAGFDQTLAQSDVLVCLLPLTTQTQGILNKQAFDRLPRGAFVINCARGAHLVENDLLAALDEQQLGGALLDVFLEEPLPRSHPFWNHPGIVITPHEAARSLVKESVKQTLASMRAISRGERPEGQVNRQSGY